MESQLNFLFRFVLAVGTGLTGVSVLAGDLDSNTLLNQSLRISAREGRLFQVQRALEQGAELNSRSEFGQTALMMAARYNQSHIVEYLISQGADPNASDFYGATPLLEAAKNCSADSMRRLVSSKASINHADRGGITALIYVAKNGCVALVDYLARSMKANVHLKDQTGQSALDYAAQEGVVEVDGPYLNIAKMLMDLGAKTDFYLTAEQLEKGSTQSHFKRSKPATPRPVPVPAQPSRSTRVIIK